MTTVTTATTSADAPVRKRSRRPMVLACVGVAVAATGLGIAMPAWRGGDASLPSGPAFAAGMGSFYVEPRSFDLTVVASGQLDTAEKVEIKSLVEGNTTIIEVVPEGTAVKAGDVLVRLNDEDIRSKIEQQALALEKAEADKIAAEHNLEIERNEAASALKAVAVKLELAKLDMAKWEQGDLPKKRKELEEALEKAKRTIVRARRDYELSKQLHAEQFISLGELEDDELAVIEAENALEMAKLDIEVHTKFTVPKERSKFETDVEQAEAELERTRRKNEIDLARVTADLASKTRQFEIVSERMAELEDQLAKTVLTAPKDGLVVYASTSPSRRWRNRDPIAEGRQVQYSEPLITLPDMRNMVATLKVHEALVAQVRVGQSVSVTVDARPNEPLEGKVISVAVMAEEGNWMNPQLREYDVKVALDVDQASNAPLKPAMRCTGTIQVGHVEDALAVPVQAIFAEGRQRFVYVPAGGGKVKRQVVRTGRIGEAWVEVREGLEAGAHVILRRPRPGEIAAS